ncbi:hypothetical protein LWI28_009080 [Acer negundo]|uniref:Uncharacterized protein n=1 Tax=Acer negundo TaxID=4023 RepID=A0AAD5IPR9_ACENE|nr:hypothetical protein LWI28_009080 [Acer negundo]
MRFQYKDEVRKNPLNYDNWFDYIRLEESVGNKDRIREVYDRAIANLPPAQAEIYLSVELDAGDMEQTRDVYRVCLKLIPHKKFSFAKIWLLAAQFEIRQLNLNGAGQILGNAIGKAPKDKRTATHGANMQNWRDLCLKPVELEPFLSLQLPSQPWTCLSCCGRHLAYIEFEKSEGEYERTRALYERLLDRTKNLKVWISYAKIEAFDSKEDDGGSDIPEDDVDESKAFSVREDF